MSKFSTLTNPYQITHITNQLMTTHVKDQEEIITIQINIE